MFPLVAPPLIAARRGTALAVGVACYAACLLVSLAYLRFTPDGPIALNHESMAFWLNVVRYNPALRFPEFVLGIVFARFYLDHPLRPGRAGAFGAVGSVVLAAILVAILAHSQALPYPVLHNGLLAPLFALLIVSLALGRGPIAAFLSTRPLIALGNASYSLYLLHIPLVIYWSKVTGHLPEPVRSRGVINAAFLLFAVVGSLLCHRYIEVPMRARVLRRGVARLPSGANP
jgi:peptidoglycan/LPS O-acetylase OafA/YrhL